MNTVTTDQATAQPRTQRFYCPGCREYHEAPALLEAVRAEGKRIERERKDDNEHNDNRN